MLQVTDDKLSLMDVLYPSASVFPSIQSSHFDPMQIIHVPTCNSENDGPCCSIIRSSTRNREVTGSECSFQVGDDGVLSATFDFYLKTIYRLTMARTDKRGTPELICVPLYCIRHKQLFLRSNASAY